ncbi:hypothetical protein GOP47_0004609 [Adiantum capillus-veneris]|uniref:Inositol-tetrakisphosphate 1-kinase n=1 Tax=Adiantum capillus-veneris TaxID=13818 RepID=A0A9D4V902_ADICA|nr:hypothetical protein GOP47_0004609 [Adiantum capillus-veneris]
MAGSGGADDAEFVIGYALLEKKRRSFLQESLVRRGQQNGIRFIPLDLQRPLASQGPFHAILHKLSSSSWDAQLAEYSLSHPHVLIVDPPQFIERLHNRISMLQAVADLQTASPSSSDPSVQVPTQCVLHGGEAEEERVALLERLHFPVIAKPLLVDGSAKSHAMSLAFNPHSLAKLKPPLVLQEFINHGGVIFKVYVAGGHVQCVRRKSLPDVSQNDVKDVREPLSFCQISNTSSSDSSDDPELQDVELPPPGFISKVASGLKKALVLRLFNFDIIRDVNAANRYYIIDINYFPGYAKMPDYEMIMTEFFLSLVKEHAALT